MQRTDEFRTEDLIDLGVASVETKGVIGLQDDTPAGQPLPNRVPFGISAD
ncbi:benenodin family lasso peptide [Caulobacter segnis]